MSVAKHLIAGRSLEDQLFPYPKLRDLGLGARTSSAAFAAESVVWMVAHDIDSAIEDRIATIFEGTNGVPRLYRALSGLNDLGKATGVGRDKILASMPQLLRDAAGIYARYTVELARTCDFLLRKMANRLQVSSMRSRGRGHCR
jgi:hypothetical protein